MPPKDIKDWLRIRILSYVYIYTQLRKSMPLSIILVFSPHTLYEFKDEKRKPVCQIFVILQ